MVLGGLALGVYLSLPAWQQFREQRAIAADRVADTRRKEAQLVRALRQNALTSTSVARETARRRRGWLAPGEVRLQPGTASGVSNP